MATEAVPLSVPNSGSHTDSAVDPVYAAVGIPQGIVTDPQSHEQAGAVRRRGEIVFIDVRDYAVWTDLLVPRPRSTVPAASSSSETEAHPPLARLRQLELFVELDSWATAFASVGALRPVPLGVGLGNSQGDPTRFQVQGSSESNAPAIALDPVENLLWWEFDGQTTVQQAASRVGSHLPDVADDFVFRNAVRLVLKLMANKLAYLDACVVTTQR